VGKWQSAFVATASFFTAFLSRAKEKKGPCPDMQIAYGGAVNFLDFF
jgi:hypothetical protein